MLPEKSSGLHNINIYTHNKQLTTNNNTPEQWQCSGTLFSWVPLLCVVKSNYTVLFMFLKHFKNSQQIDYATDNGISYAD
jgi:hypothetical protein